MYSALLTRNYVYVWKDETASRRTRKYRTQIPPCWYKHATAAECNLEPAGAPQLDKMTRTRNVCERNITRDDIWDEKHEENSARAVAG
jgi:hypothetical protein